MAAAKSIEAGFLSPMADGDQDEDQHNLELGHGVQHSQHAGLR
jgi:hypothetical protein